VILVGGDNDVTHIAVYLPWEYALPSYATRQIPQCFLPLIRYIQGVYTGKFRYTMQGGGSIPGPKKTLDRQTLHQRCFQTTVI